MHSESSIRTWSRLSEFELEYIGMTKNGFRMDLDWSLTINYAKDSVPSTHL